MVIPPDISTKFKSTTNCPVLNCAAYQITFTMKHNPGVIKQAEITEKEAIMSWNTHE